MVGLRDVFLFHSSSDPQGSSLFPVLAPSLPQPSPSLAPPPPPPPAPPQQQPPSLLHSLPQHQFAHVMANDSNDDEERRISEFQLWHHHHQRAVAGIPTMEAALGTGSSGGTTCQDCGNQAKKDCSHRRCRTCCKSRGFECPTHVKSTWVPAARRRERQHLLHSSSGTATTNTGKKPRLTSSQAAASLTSNSATTPSRSFDTGSSHQEMEMGGSGFPGHVTAPAVFKCVRVTSIEDGDDEYAYQAAVKIGGRVFKGFLYDQGLDDSSSSSLPNLSELHLGDLAGGSGGGGSGGKNANASSFSSILDASDAYAVAAAAAAAAAASSSSGMLGGGNYGNPMN